jgi:hypothetical protein
MATASHRHTFTISKYGGMISTADFDFKGGGKDYRRARVARHHGHNASHVVEGMLTVFRRPAAEKWGKSISTRANDIKQGFFSITRQSHTLSSPPSPLHQLELLAVVSSEEDEDGQPGRPYCDQNIPSDGESLICILPHGMPSLVRPGRMQRLHL